jgi:predicted PhzF superfamily epimerase YddE/YHI9
MERLETERREITFHTLSGPLPVSRSDTGYIMNFPIRPSERIGEPLGLAEALGTELKEVFGNAFNYIVLLRSEDAVRSIVPDFAAIQNHNVGGVIVTAAGSAPYDFVSRYFAPAKGIPEDPVTGGAHTMLVPYWANRLGKSKFLAYQASRRGGEIKCTLVDDRVLLEGSCVFFFEGTAEY